MATGKASIDTITRLLEKSGLPVKGTSREMDMASLGAEQKVREAANIPAALEPYRQTYKAQLDQIAAMDAKLAGVYSDPNSNLYIEHPGQRENFYMGAENRGYGAAGKINTAMRNTEAELESQVNEAVSLFDKLTSLTRREEAYQEALAKKNKPKKGAKTAIQKMNEKFALAGLSDPEAIDIFDRAPQAFQRQWVREYQRALQSGEVAPYPDPTPYNKNDLVQAYNLWQKTTGVPMQSEAEIKNQDEEDESWWEPTEPEDEDE